MNLRRLPLALAAGTTLALVAGTEGAMTVALKTPDGKPAVGIKVVIQSDTHIGGAVTTLSASDGVARFYKLMPGNFLVKVVPDQFLPVAFITDVNANATSALRLKLKPKEEVSLTAEEAPPLLDMSTVTTGQIVTGKELERYPFSPERTRDDYFRLFGAAAPMYGRSPLTSAKALGWVWDSSGWWTEPDSIMVDGQDVSYSPVIPSYLAFPAPSVVNQMEVRSGGVLADTLGGSGLTTHFHTLSGGNRWEADGQWSTQPPSLSARTKLPVTQDYRSGSYRMSGTVSGPLIRDRLWVVASVASRLAWERYAPDPEAMTIPGERRLARRVDEDALFFKVTWQPTPHQRWQGEWYARHHAKDWDWALQVAARSSVDEANSRFFQVRYTFQRPGFILDASLSQGTWPVVTRITSSVGPTVDVEHPDTYRPINRSYYGPYTSPNDWNDKTPQARLDLTFPVLAGNTSHLVKMGAHRTEFRHGMTTRFPEAGWYVNYDSPKAFGEIAADWVPTKLDLLQNLLNQGSAYTEVRNRLDVNHDGVVDRAELDAYVFDTPYAGDADKYGYTFLHNTQGPTRTSRPRQVRDGFYAQDSFSWGRWTLLPGLRMDRSIYISDREKELYSSGFEPAPRIGATFDLTGNAQTKLWAFLGRFYDDEFSSIAVTGMGDVTEWLESIHIGGTWIPLGRHTGTDVVSESVVYGKRMRRPCMDEVRLGVERLVESRWGRWTFACTATHREHPWQVAAYDPRIYTNPDELERSARRAFNLGETPTSELSPEGQRIVAAFRSLELPKETFANTRGSVDDMIQRGWSVFINAPGARRTLQCLEFNAKREFQQDWTVLAAFAFLRGWGAWEGPGQAAEADPRLPYNRGRANGMLTWTAKVSGLVQITPSFSCSGILSGRSGITDTPVKFSGYGVVVQAESPELFDTPLVGSLKSPSAWSLDLQANWERRIGRTTLALSASVLNAFNSVQSNLYAQAPRQTVIGVRVAY